MAKEGYYNEFKFVNELNNKFIWQLSDEFILFLKKLFGSNIQKKDYVLCWKSFKTDKTDIIICINNKKKNISIKSGKNNSVHLEKITGFINFLKENKISDELIDIYYNYHYACDEYGNRISAKYYQEKHVMEIQKFNK